MSYTAASAASFIGSLGVNTHLSWTSTPYGNLSAVQNELSYLGLHAVRDNVANTTQEFNALSALAAMGVKVDMIVNSDLSGFMSLADRLETAHPGSVIAVEGLNEVSPGSSSAAQLQQNLYNAVKADPLLAGADVYNLSLAGPKAFGSNLSAYATDANAHIYYGGGQPEYGWSPNDSTYWWSTYLKAAQSNATGLPTVVTETGATTAVGNQTSVGVDQATQAKQILNSFMDGAKSGVAMNYIYELVDSRNNGASDSESHFGLYNWDGTAKQSATAIHNFTSVLTSHGALSGTPGSLDYTISGVPQWGGQMLFEQGDGTYDVVVWAEPDIWNESSSTPISAPNTPITLNLANAANVSIYDPMSGTSAVKSLGTTSQVAFNVTDHPLIVEISPGSGSGSTGGGSTSPPSSTQPTSPPTSTPADPAPPADPVAGTSVSTGAAVYTAPSGVTDITLTGSYQGVYGNNAGDTFHSGGNVAYIFGGTGNDVFDLGRGGDWAQGGGGADTFAFAATPWAGGGITDFSSGDVLDLTGLLHASGYTGSDPIGAGYIKVTDDGAGDAQIWSNLNSTWWLVTTLEHVAPAHLQMQGDTIVMAGSGGTGGIGAGGGAAVTTAASSYTVADGVTDVTLTGAQQAIYGNNAGDTFHSGDNVAYIFGGTGNDTFDLGRGGDWAQGGGGNDTFAFAATPWAAGGITDFNTGDKVDLTGLLHASGYTGSDPIGAGYIKVTDDGAGDAQIWSNLNSHWWLVTTLEHVQASSLHMSGAFIAG